jgi:hypothetical protein
MTLFTVGWPVEPNSNFRRHFLGLLLCNEAQAAALLSVLRAEFSRTCRYVTHFTKKAARQFEFEKKIKLSYFDNNLAPKASRN